MKRRRKLSPIKKWLSIILIFSVIILGIHHLFTRNSKAMEESVISSEIYPGLNLKTIKQETDLYTLFINQPVTENKNIDEEINEWIMEEKEDFKSRVKESKKVLKENEFTAHLNIQTKTKKLADKIYTLELESYQISSGANGSTKIKPIIVDLNTDNILGPSDIFSFDENLISEIKEIVYRQVEKNSELNSYIFEDLLKESLYNYEGWKISVNPESLIFSFDQYEVAAANVGVVTIEIPMDQIYSYLNPTFIKKLNLEEPEKQTELKSDGKYIALTFDDGPHPKVTPRILKTLEEHNVKATFYMLGNQVEYYPSLAKQVLDEGHELGNHTKSHKNLTHLGASQVKEEIQSSSDNIQNATTSLPKSLRPPYGAFNNTVKEVSNELDLPIIMWSVDSLDWKSRNVSAINREVMSTVHPGAIVLLHDIHSTTADALPSLLKNLENEGYEFITVSQLIELGELEGIGPHHRI